MKSLPLISTAALVLGFPLVNIPRAQLWGGPPANSPYVIAVPEAAPGHDPPNPGPVLLSLADLLCQVTPQASLTDPSFDGTTGIAYEPAQGLLFVSNRVSGSISMFRRTGDATFAPLGTITSPGMTAPHGLAISPWGELFAVDQVTDQAYRFLIGANASVAPNPAQPTVSLGNGVHATGVTFRADGEMFVSSNGSGYLIYRYVSSNLAAPEASAMMPNADCPTISIPGSDSKGYLAVSPQGDLWVSGLGNDTLYQVSLASPCAPAAVAVLTVPRVTGVAFSPTGDLVTSSHNQGGIRLYQLDTMTQQWGQCTATLPTNSLGQILTLPPYPPADRFEVVSGPQPNRASVVLHHSVGVTGGTLCLQVDPALASLCTVRRGADLPATAQVLSNAQVLDAFDQPIPGGILLGWVNDPLGPPCLGPGSHEVLVLEMTSGPAVPATGGIVAIGTLPGSRVAPVSPYLVDSVSDCGAPTMTLSLSTHVATGLRVGIPFVRGNSNCDGRYDLSDPITTLRWLFIEPTPLCCEDASDANDDGVLDVSDPILSLHCLFLGPPCPAPSYPVCGQDPTGDGLGCAAATPVCLNAPCPD